MSYIEHSDEFEFKFKTRRKLQKFVNEVKENFPKVVITTSGFQKGNICYIQKETDSISVIKEIDAISKKCR